MHTLVAPRPDYCYVLYMGLPLETAWNFWLVQNVAVRLRMEVSSSNHNSCTMGVTLVSSSAPCYIQGASVWPIKPYMQIKHDTIQIAKRPVFRRCYPFPPHCRWEAVCRTHGAIFLWDSMLLFAFSEAYSKPGIQEALVCHTIFHSPFFKYLRILLDCQRQNCCSLIRKPTKYIFLKERV